MGMIDRQRIEQPPLRFGLVQGNMTSPLMGSFVSERDFEDIQEAFSKVQKKKPDLIIWPETATPFFFQDAKEYQPLFLKSKQTNAFLLFGTLLIKFRKGRVDHYNSAYLVSPSGI